MQTARVRLAADDPALLEQALRLEAADGPDGTHCLLSVEADALRVDLQAPDVSSLRAALHSLLRLADTVQRTP